MLQYEETFPYDCLDEILCYACEGSTRRVLQLGLVCRFWNDRFKANDRMWSLLLLDRSRHLFGYQRRGGQKVSLLKPRNWEGTGTSDGASNPREPLGTLYERETTARKAARNLWPMRPITLHPIEDCTLGFRCPVYAEALRTVAPGVEYCDVCEKEVYQVCSEEELQMRKAQRHCVRMSPRDMAPNFKNRTVIHVALAGETAEQCKILCQALISGFESLSSSPTEVDRSVSLYPEATVKPILFGLREHFEVHSLLLRDGLLNRGTKNQYSFCVVVGNLAKIQQEAAEGLPPWLSKAIEMGSIREVRPSDVSPPPVGYHLCSLGNGLAMELRDRFGFRRFRDIRGDFNS